MNTDGLTSHNIYTLDSSAISSIAESHLLGSRGSGSTPTTLALTGYRSGNSSVAKTMLHAVHMSLQSVKTVFNTLSALALQRSKTISLSSSPKFGPMLGRLPRLPPVPNSKRYPARTTPLDPVQTGSRGVVYLRPGRALRLSNRGGVPNR